MRPDGSGHQLSRKIGLPFVALLVPWSRRLPEPSVGAEPLGHCIVEVQTSKICPKFENGAPTPL